MQIGASRKLISLRTRQIGMMGYGALQNRVHHAHSDLYVRTCLIQDQNGKWLALANAEICFVTQAMHQAVLRELAQQAPEISLDNLVLSSQHTHSAPGGYSHYMFYNVTVPDFQPEIFDAIVKAFVSSILEAREKAQPARLSYAELAFPEEIDVAFNRAIKAYNQNPENTALTDEQTHLGIDRTMYLLQAQTETGDVLAVLNWFGVHATSIGPDNQGISADNKGYAAIELERYFAERGHATVCLFAQAAAGDVSPNFYGQGKNWPRGKFEDEIQNAQHNGHQQAQHAKYIVQNARFKTLSDHCDSELFFADLSCTPCDPAFTNGQTGLRSAPAAHGIPFLEGTAIDGKGISKTLAKAVSVICQLQQKLRLKKLQQSDPQAWQQEQEDYQMQAPKIIAVESGRKRFLGFQDFGKLHIPERLEPVMAELNRLFKLGAIQEHSWTPQILPIQIIRIGELAIATFPGEITTTAARRLRQCIADELKPDGVEHVLIWSYVNAYFGYTTTPEEYSIQNYEGGHTVFGRWSLPAFQTLYARLAKQMALSKAQRQIDRSLQSPVFSERELALRTGKRWT